MVEAHAVVAVLERRHALDFVSLDHRGEQPRTRGGVRPSAAALRACQSATAEIPPRICPTGGPVPQPRFFGLGADFFFFSAYALVG